MKKPRLYSILVITSVLVWSCANDTIFPQGESADVVCFETEILPLFISKCSNAGCHNSIDREEGLDLTTYKGIRKEVNPGKPNDGELIESILDKGDDIMPPPPNPPLSRDQINLIQRWISEGAQETRECSVVTSCDSISNVSYAVNVKPIIDLYCTGCHNSTSPGGGYDLSNFGGTEASAKDRSLLGSIQQISGFSAMPRNADKIPSCDIATIETWILEGTKNN